MGCGKLCFVSSEFQTSLDLDEQDDVESIENGIGICFRENRREKRVEIK